jgi:hypothetical protein
LSDEIDAANDHADKVLDNQIKAVRSKAELVKGEPGDCELCGEHSMRLVHGVCAPCRDRYKLK